MTAPLAPAHKITQPTGKPVTAILPTGGSTVDARPRSPEALAYDPPKPKFRKSTVGGKAYVTADDVLCINGPTLAILHEYERREALASLSIPSSRPPSAAAGIGGGR